MFLVILKASQTVSALDFNTTSDITIKTDVETITNALELFLQYVELDSPGKQLLKPSFGCYCSRS
jgi:hypothetical protein